MAHLGHHAPEKPLERLLIAHPHVIHEIDLAGLFQRQCHRLFPLTNQYAAQRWLARQATVQCRRTLPSAESIAAVNASSSFGP